MKNFLPSFAFNKLVFVLLICSVTTFKVYSQNCTAKVSATETRVFMCHNLGAANTSADPFTPSWEINGGYWQWGRLAQAASGPTGLGSGQANDASITGWNTTDASNGAWSDGSKTANDPCPSGFRVPTKALWDGVITNNTNINVGTWTNSSTNYGSGKKFGSNLTLPASGVRAGTNGLLYYRGELGSYATSTESGSSYAFGMYFSNNYANTTANYNRSFGWTVRCISQSSILGSIGSINCSNATISGTLTTNQVAAGVSASVPYTGGNSGAYSGQTITSTGVTGLTATLSAGTFANGSGSLVYNITGTPGSDGTASFALNIGGKTCTLSVNVNSGGNSGSQCSAKISATETRVFMCHNLGAANTSADPFTPSWEINGGYWQWGRLAHAAAGPTGPGASQANGGLISGWNTTPASSGAWSDASKTANDPCPTGFRVPTRTQLEGLVSNNTIINVGTWINGSSNYNSGIKFGNNLFLPAAGWRSSINGELVGRNSSGFYWSSTENGSPTVVSLEVASSGTSIFPNDNAIFGNSVRCISQSSMSGSIGSINCTSPTITGTLTANQAASGVSATVTYTSGNGGSHNGQSVISTGITGLTATLSAGTFANGSGSLVYNITGTPGSAGTASFALNIGGKTCTLSVNVNSGGNSGSQCSAKISTTEIREFMCHNLGAANTAADPFTPSWEINGGYWQWGRFTQAAAGPTGPGAGQANDSYVIGWNTTAAPNDAWTDDSKTVNDPCPTGFRIPTKAQWEGVLANNIATNVGTWSNSPTNYGSGKKIGNNLFLPSSGARDAGAGYLENRGFVGCYWSSLGVGDDGGWYIVLLENEIFMYSNISIYGFSLRCISLNTTGSIGSINCTSPTITGTLTANQAASGVSATVTYTGGNGGSHNGQSVESTGITGLTATLATGTFANGNGSLVYNITGTPGSAGSASFALNIGGKTCTLVVPVQAPSGNGLTFDIDDNICGAPGSTVQVPIRVRGFSNMYGYTMSVSIANSSIAQITSLQTNITQGTSLYNVVNTTSAVLVWSDFSPITLPDNSIVGTITITLSGVPPSNSDVLLVGTPVEIAALQAINGVQTEVTPNVLKGSVCLSGNFGISGRITREDNIGIGDVTVQLTGSSNQSAVTDNQGNYSFSNLSSGGNYTITPLKNKKHRNGVNIADMVAIQQHIAIVNQLNSPFKLIAADVFRNNKINIQDLVATQRMVAIVDTVFSNNTSWQFVDKSHVFSNPANPWLQPYPESRIISGLSGNISNADFTGVKIGDVNLSNNPTGISGMWNDDRNFESLLIKIPERVQVIDGYVRIPILVGNDFDLQGIQFSLVFDRESLSIEAINPSEVMDEFNETNINLKWSDDGLAVLAWAAPGGIGRSLVAGQKLFELIMKAGKKAPEWISLGDKLRLGEEFTESMAVGNRLNEYNLKLETTSTVKDKEDSFRFAPNPFNNSTNLYMNLANSTVVRLKLLDSDGKVLFDESKWVEEGSQTWHLSDHNLSVSRVIFYQIQTDSNVISGRLLKLN